MRRPLAYTGLLFICIIAIIEMLIPIKLCDLTELNKKQCTISGQLYRKEIKNQEDSVSYLLYIRDCSSTDYSFSDYEIKNIICYLDADNISFRSLPPLGTYVSISGQFRNYEQATNTGMFDARKYYDILNISIAVYDTKINNYETNPQSTTWHIKEALSQFRYNISLLSDICFDTEDSAVIKTMLLGDKSTLTSELKNLYAQNGIVHILSISGLHISLFGMAFYDVLTRIRLPRWLSSSIALALIICYGIMTGNSCSTMRAVIMFAFRMAAIILHRTYDITTACVFAAILLLISQPKYIYYSGFLFSFGAIFAIIIIYPLFQRIFPDILAAGLAINTVTIPISLHNYYYFPIFSLLINICILPVMSFLLFISLICLALCALFIPAAHILANIPHFILWIIRNICQIIANIPFSQMITGKPGFIRLLVYIIIVSLTLAFHNRQTRLQIYLHLLAACMILCTPPQLGTCISFLDVGQGDCIHITSNGANFIIDGGSSSVSNLAKYRLNPYLMASGVSHVDAIFISHLDMDHYNGILELISLDSGEAPTIGCLVLSEASVTHGGMAYDELSSLATSHNIPICTIKQGEVYRQNNILIHCLYPDSNITGKNLNAESMVLYMQTPKIELLLTGDIEEDGEKKLTEYLRSSQFKKIRKQVPARGNNILRILKVAHHGSKNSTYDDFLNVFQPDMAVISSGKNNTYGHPHLATLDRLRDYLADSMIYRTDKYGQIMVSDKFGTLRINKFVDSD